MEHWATPNPVSAPNVFVLMQVSVKISQIIGWHLGLVPLLLPGWVNPRNPSLQKVFRLIHTKHQASAAEAAVPTLWMVLMLTLSVNDTGKTNVTLPLAVTLTLGVNGTGINQCNPSTSGDTATDADPWCEWYRYKSM